MIKNFFKKSKAVRFNFEGKRYALRASSDVKLSLLDSAIDTIVTHAFDNDDARYDAAAKIRATRFMIVSRFTNISKYDDDIGLVAHIVDTPNIFNKLVRRINKLTFRNFIGDVELAVKYRHEENLAYAKRSLEQFVTLAENLSKDMTGVDIEAIMNNLKDTAADAKQASENIVENIRLARDGSDTNNRG